MTAAGGVAHIYEGNGALSRVASGTPSDPATSFLLQDYDGRYLRTGHCHDVAGLGAVTVADISAVVAVFGTSEPQATYDIRRNVSPTTAPDSAIAIQDITQITAEFGQVCPDTGHFFYNGDGLRMRKQVAPAGVTQTTDYVWDTGTTPAAVLEETTGSATVDHVNGHGLIAAIQGSSASFYLSDGLGSTVALTNAAGVVTDRYRYDAFGALRSQQGSSTQPFRFAGQQQDTNVGGQPYYLRARYYSPTVGRFLTPDPALGSHAERPQSWNAYAYVQNNPVNLVDPSGLDSDDEPQPVPALVAPEDREEYCAREAEKCRKFGEERGFIDAYVMVCIPLQKECELTGNYDWLAYHERWAPYPIRKNPKEGPFWHIGEINFPRTGTGGYLNEKDSKEGRGFNCGMTQPFANGWNPFRLW
jgi:RHS repeat-associated protein